MGTNIELEILKGIVIYYKISMIALPVLGGFMIWEWWNKKQYKKYKKELEQKRQEFNEDVERTGQRMKNEDSILRILKEDISTRKQNIKYIGYFSGEEVNKKMGV